MDFYDGKDQIRYLYRRYNADDAQLENYRRIESWKASGIIDEECANKLHMFNEMQFKIHSKG